MSFSRINRAFAIVGQEQTLKCDMFSMCGHDLIIRDEHQIDTLKYVNVTDLGYRSLLTQHRLFKDYTFKIFFKKLSDKYNIPLAHASIWHYACRKNGTYRHTRAIQLDFNEPAPNNPHDYPPEVQLTHTIPTAPGHNRVKSVHQRIGDQRGPAVKHDVLGKRAFFMLDERQIETVPSDDDDNPRLLIALKYFDVFTQKLYFVDWLFCVNNVATVEDIASYVQTKVLQKDIACLKQCKQYCDRIATSKSQTIRQRNPFKFYEEDCANDNDIHSLHFDTTIGGDGSTGFFCGDIFVFQMNLDHPYFDAHPASIQVTPSKNNSISSVYTNASDFIISLPRSLSSSI